MKHIFSSASRIVFILVTLAAIGLTYKGTISGEAFMALALLAYKHFFDNSSKTNTAQTEVIHNQPQG